MGVLQRFGDIMASNVNALLDAAEDPVKMTDQMLRKMNEELAEVKKETAAVMAEEANARRKKEDLEAKINEYKSSAAKALQTGNEADAKTLIERKQEYESQLETATKTWQIAKTNADNMKQMFDKLNSDIVTLNSRRENVKSQTAMASAQERANKIADKMGKSNAASAFSRMEEKAQRRLDEATAATSLASVGGPTDVADELNNKYKAGTSATVDAELEAMKAELGLS